MALDLAGRKQDTVTDALTAYLLKRQGPDGRWTVQSNRPPLEQSTAMTTFLSAYYLDRFARAENQDAIAAANQKAMVWLAKSKEKSQENLNAKLWAFAKLGANEATETVERLRAKVLANQNEDGGSSQLPELKSDAYATGQTLYIVDETGLADDQAVVRRGVEFLLKTKQPDGSWSVETRSKPIQKFFDNGDPHSKSQFISIAATSWAVAALCRSGRE